MFGACLLLRGLLLRDLYTVVEKQTAYLLSALRILAALADMDFLVRNPTSALSSPPRHSTQLTRLCKQSKSIKFGNFGLLDPLPDFCSA